MTSRRWRLTQRLPPWMQPRWQHKLAPEHAERAAQIARWKRGQAQMEQIIFDLFGALREGNTRRARKVFAPDVEWQGLSPEQRCAGADRVLDGLRFGLASRPGIDALEVTRGRDSVVVGIRHDATDTADPEHGHTYLAFTFDGGLVSRVVDAATHAEALEIVGIREPPRWP